jgi:DNA-binding response OmpR family regulator
MNSSAALRRRRPADFTVLLYSDDEATRERMRMAIGARPAPDLGTVDFLDATSIDEVIAAADAGMADVLLLDGEAWPTGGMGISRQLKNELTDCPPVCLLIARQADRWLAAWSQADAVIAHPLDPVATARTVAELLRTKLGVVTQLRDTTPLSA